MKDDRTLEKLIRRLACPVEDRALLGTALTHRSAVNEGRGHGLEDNERLEFLGDAVIDAVLSEELVRRMPGWTEGELTRARAALVQEQALAEVARGLRLGEALRLGRGEEKTGGRDKDSLLCGAFEAVIGAISLDRGIEACRPLLRRLFDARLRALEDGIPDDPKTALQERCAALGAGVPRYPVIARDGPPHARTYTVAVRVDDRELAVGSGPSKKEAAQRAAWASLRSIDLLSGGGDG